MTKVTKNVVVATKAIIAKAEIPIIIGSTRDGAIPATIVTGTSTANVDDTTVDVKLPGTAPSSFPLTEPIYGHDICLLIEQIAMSVSRGISDAMSFSELISFGYSREVSDSATLSDSFRFGVGFNPSEFPSIGESLKFGISTVLVDTINISDNIATEFGVVRGTSDSTSLSDSIDFSVNKSISESFSITETLAFINGFGREFVEAASINDMPLFTVGLNLQDITSITDSLMSASGIASLSSDTSTLSEQLRFSSGVLKSDLRTISEIFKKSIGKTFVDTVTISETMLFSMGKEMTASDTLSMSDIVVYGAGPTTADSSTTSDTLYFGIGATQTDTSTLVEIFNREFTAYLGFSELTSLSELVSLSIGTQRDLDSDYFGVGPQLFDDYVDSDYSDPKYSARYGAEVILGIGKVFADTATLSDSGSLTLDNYVAADYVNAAYAGVITTF